MRWDEIKSRLLSLMNEEDVTHERPLCSGSGAARVCECVVAAVGERHVAHAERVVLTQYAQ